MAQVNAANAQIQSIAAQPEVQQLSKIAGAIVAVAAVGAVLYDWCTTDAGKA